MQRLLNRLLASASAGLLGMCGPAQAGPIQTLLGLPDWMDLSVDYTTEPMGGMLGGLNPAATSWFQETVVGLSMSSGLNKERHGNRQGINPVIKRQTTLLLSEAAHLPER